MGSNFALAEDFFLWISVECYFCCHLLWWMTMFVRDTRCIAVRCICGRYSGLNKLPFLNKPKHFVEDPLWLVTSIENDHIYFEWWKLVINFDFKSQQFVTASVLIETSQQQFLKLLLFQTEFVFPTDTFSASSELSKNKNLSPASNFFLPINLVFLCQVVIC